MQSVILLATRPKVDERLAPLVTKGRRLDPEGFPVLPYQEKNKKKIHAAYAEGDAQVYLVSK